jgi:hypothetical protein
MPVACERDGESAPTNAPRQVRTVEYLRGPRPAGAADDRSPAASTGFSSFCGHGWTLSSVDDVEPVALLDPRRAWAGWLSAGRCGRPGGGATRARHREGWRGRARALAPRKSRGARAWRSGNGRAVTLDGGWRVTRRIERRPVAGGTRCDGGKVSAVCRIRNLADLGRSSWSNLGHEGVLGRCGMLLPRWAISASFRGGKR